MTPQELAKVAAKFGVSKDVAALSLEAGAAPQPVAVESKRVKQEAGPILNKLESDWLAVLKVEHPGVVFRAQVRRYKIGRGAWYKPDITAIVEGQETAWECKGPKQMRGVAKGVLALKVAASAWPEVEFILVWREAGQWRIQRIAS